MRKKGKAKRKEEDIKQIGNKGEEIGRTREERDGKKI